MDIYEKITALVPGVRLEEGATPTLYVEPASLHEAAVALRDHAELQFDFLRSLTGMDWGEEGLGVVYHLESTRLGHQLVMRTATADREHPELPTVCDVWKAAELNEREVYDYYGVIFINHPDMRRLYLRDDWVGYPLRKDFDESEELNPIRMTNEESSDFTSVYVKDDQGHTVETKQVLFEDDEYVVNVGPQHPATHGVLRFRVSLDGEVIRKLHVHCGYIHRGIEKMCESLTYPQTLALTDRLDYLGAMQNRHALCMCIEQAMGVELPERVQYIRTIMDELQRIDSHLLFFSTFCMDLGALTAFFYGFRDREMILDIFEETTGGRLILNYNTIGGVQADIHPDFVHKVKKFIAYMRPKLREYHEVFTGNVIAQERMKGVGVLSCEDAISFRGDRGHGACLGVGVRRAQAPSLRHVRQGGLQGNRVRGRRLLRPLHGAHEGNRRKHEHHRATDRQHPGRRLPGEDEARHPRARGAVLCRRGRQSWRVRRLHRKPRRQVSLPPEVPQHRAAARLVPRHHHAGRQDCRPDCHRRDVGLRGAGY